jgi:hypothetical protein
MDYFEFNKSAYYAMIGANDINEAADFYQEHVADIANDDGAPDYLTEDEAIDKLEKASGDDESAALISAINMDYFNIMSAGSEPFLILIDTNLV